MKPFFTLAIILSLIVPFTAAAQIPPDSLQAFMQRNCIPQLPARQSTTPLKTTATLQRLLAMALDNSMIYDSTQFYYTGIKRGSVFDFNMMQYQVIYRTIQYPALYNPASVFNVQVFSDSFLRWMGNTGAAQLSSAGVGMQTYDAATRLDKIVYSDTSVASPGSIFQFVYNIAGRLDEAYEIRPVFLGARDTFWKKCMYDPQGRIVTDSICHKKSGSWQPWCVYGYTYDVSSNMTQVIVKTYDTMSMSWATNAQINNTYYPGGTLKVSETADPVTGVVSAKDSFVYDNSNSFFVYWKQWTWSGSSLKPATIIQKTVNSQGLPDTMWFAQLNGQQQYINHVYVKYDYNSFGNPVGGEFYDLMSPAGSPHYGYVHYYYELYDNGVNEIKQPRTIVVYPNPANDFITLSWDDAGTQQAQLSIVNAAGQPVQQQPVLKGKAVNIARLAPGTYWLTVIGHSDMTASGRFVKN